MFNDEVKAQLKEILAKINKKIIIMYFSEGNSENVNVTKSMLEDLKEINSLINVEYYGLGADIIKKYDIVENGTLLILNEDKVNKGVYYYGPPAGYEINSFVHSLLDFGGASEELLYYFSLNCLYLNFEKIEINRKIDKDIDIKVFVGLGCPHCPGAVINAHTLAKYNPRIKGTMVEASSYIELSKKFNISSVPRIIINDGQGDLLGNQPLDVIIKTIENL